MVPDVTPSLAESTVLDFVARINAHDVEALAELLSDDHEFVDGLGHSTKGREAMRQGWSGYFRWVPDYSIEIVHKFSRGEFVALIGSAGGTCAPDGKFAAESAWRVPAAWLATVRDGRVARWQVFADNKPMYDLLARTSE